MARDAKQPIPTNNWLSGIADYDKLGGSAAWMRSIDYRSNPRELTLLPKTSKESGSTIVGLPKWADRVSSNSMTYLYDDGGNFYSRSSAGSYTLLKTIANSHGNGLKYFGEDDFVYYASDKLIGRYGPIAGTPTFADDYFGSQGGVPTNTASLQLTSASSHYATAADSASLSITGNIALEAYIKPTTLPTVGNSMTILGKWDESGVTISYKFDLYAISGFFGDGSDGSLTISSDTTYNNANYLKDATCTGTSGTTSLSYANQEGTAAFVVNEIIYIHQSQGTGAGTWQRNKIVGVTGTTSGTITLETALNATYGTGAQVLVLKQWTNVTINSGKVLTPKAWDGSKGGILAFLASGTITVTGTISGSGTYVSPGYNTQTGFGFRGGNDPSAGGAGVQGEGTSGLGSQSNSANSNGGGGGNASGGTGSAAGGGNGTAGTSGSGSGAGTAGSISGSSDLTSMTFGGGGGGVNVNSESGRGGVGGAIIFLTGVTLTISGAITANGGQGGNADEGASADPGPGAGGGAGGSVLLKCQTATLGSGLLSASGGAGGTASGAFSNGGAGGDGRVHIDYYTSYTGTTTPTINATQDNTLVTTTSYQVRFGVSSNGSASEYLTKTLSSLSTGTWMRLGVSWVASTSTATFYKDGINLGTSVGTKTAIHDNASLLYVGANKTSVIANFFNGLLDDVRIWNTTRSDSQMSTNKDVELVGTESGLVAYYKLNNAATDLTSSANDLTLVNSPTYSVDVPFSNATTRLDIDLSFTTGTNTYTLATAIDESSSTKKLPFTPTKDPQKSMAFKIDTIGTGNWTLTIHDGVNRQIASVTVSNASLATGFYEFTFSTPWSPVLGQQYHAHITSTVADGKVVTNTASDFSTAQYYTYYQFLVTDSDFHAIDQFLNMLAICNGRYLATFNFNNSYTYNPHQLKFPAGYRARCVAKWNEYFAIGCWKGSAITDYDQGVIFFWDGTSQTYNFFVEVPEGGVNAMYGQNGELHIIAGYKGDYLLYTGGSKARKIKRVPKIEKNKYVEVFPGAMTMWQSLLRYGVNGNSDSSNVERGVYTYGSLNINYAESLSYDFPLSTGNRGSTVKVGLVFPAGGKLLIGWKDNTAYGVDVVDTAGSPFSTGTIESLITDLGLLWKGKTARYLRADFVALASGESVAIKYKLDRATDWTSSTTSTVGDTSLRLPINFGNNREVQIAVDLGASGSTAPTILEYSIMEDPTPEEQENII